MFKGPALLRQTTSLKVDFRRETEHKFSMIEFIVALVKMAVNLHVLSGHLEDVSQAVDELVGVGVQGRLGVRVTSVVVIPPLHCTTARSTTAPLHTPPD